MHGSQRYGELVELTADDIWQIADAAGDQELRRLAHRILVIDATAKTPQSQFTESEWKRVRDVVFI